MKGMPATFNSRVKANLFYWFPAGCCGHCVKKATVRMKKNSFQTQARWTSGSKGKKTFIKLSDYFIRFILRGEKVLAAIYGGMCHIWKALCGWAEALGHKRNRFVFPDSWELCLEHGLDNSPFAVRNTQSYLVEKVTQGNFGWGGKQYHISSGFMCSLNPEVMFFLTQLKERALSSSGHFFQLTVLSFSTFRCGTYHSNIWRQFYVL